MRVVVVQRVHPDELVVAPFTPSTTQRQLDMHLSDLDLTGNVRVTR